MNEVALEITESRKLVHYSSIVQTSIYEASLTLCTLCYSPLIRDRPKRPRSESVSAKTINFPTAFSPSPAINRDRSGLATIVRQTHWKFGARAGEAMTILSIVAQG